MNQPDRHSVRRVILPSGKAIEVVYFEDAPAGAGRRRGPAGQTTDGLHVCPSCSSNFVQPLGWEESGPDHWEMSLRCPVCEWTGAGIFERELVERYEDELDASTEVLLRDLKRLMRANMEDEIDRFVAALAADQIWPMDF